jgi:hypothetical protein
MHVLSNYFRLGVSDCLYPFNELRIEMHPNIKKCTLHSKFLKDLLGLPRLL